MNGEIVMMWNSDDLSSWQGGNAKLNGQCCVHGHNSKGLCCCNMCSKKTRNKVGGVARVGRDRTRGAWTVIGTERDGLQQGGMGKVANEIDQNVARQGPRIELRVSRSETWTAAKEEATQSQ